MDADIVSKIPSKKSVGYAVASVALIYGLVYKYSIPCFACDEGSFWYKCTEGTGKGTKSCDASKVAENRMKNFSGFAANFSTTISEGAGAFMDNIWEFTSEDLPGIISEFIGTMKELILGLKDKMVEKIYKIIEFLKEKVNMFLIIHMMVYTVIVYG